MTDKELIQALRHCASDDEYGCLRCPGEATCDECSGKSLLDAADRLEALLAENEHLREITKMAPQWRPVSNADHIRAMTDEELAKIIMCPYDNDHNNCVPGSNCLDCCLKWLQQPYESEGTP